MAERAASLVDEVLPRVPVRHWVLTRPYRLRDRLAWDHALCRAVLGVYARARLAVSAHSARAHGICDGQTGTVTVIQRVGGALNCDIHFHSLVAAPAMRDSAAGASTAPTAPRPLALRLGVGYRRCAAAPDRRG